MKKYVFLISIIMFISSPAFSDAYPNGFNYMKTITVPDSNCDDNLTDFPYYFIITDDSDIGGNMENTRYF